MPPRAEKPIFKDLVIALAGSLGGQWTDANISRWVSLRAGRFASQMSAEVTHLVCSDEEFKARGPRVKEALKRGKNACHLVTKDWLEDSIHAKKRLSEKEFEVDKVLRRERKRERRERRMKRGVEMAVRAVNPYLYHTYRDGTVFRYEVTISREEGGVERRYEMSLYESNAKPHLYWFVAKFFKRKGDSQPNYYRPSDSPGPFWREFGLFEHFFEKKTGIPWERRLMLCTGVRPHTTDEGVTDAPADGAEPDKGLPEGDMKDIWYKLEEEGRRFVYEPPTGGKPLGWAPKEFMPVVREEAEVQAQTTEARLGVVSSVSTDQDSNQSAGEVLMADTGDDRIAEAEDEQQTTTSDPKHPDVEEVQEGTDMTEEKDTKDTGVDEAQEVAAVFTDANINDESVEEVQEDTEMTTDPTAKNTSVDEAEEATAMITDPNTKYTSVDEAQVVATVITGADTKDASVDEVQEDAYMAADENSMNTSAEEVQEVVAEITDAHIRDTSPEEVQEDSGMAIDANTNDTSVDETQGIVSDITDAHSKDTSVGEVQEAAAIITDENTEHTDIDGVQETVAVITDGNANDRPSEAITPSTLDDNISPPETTIL